MVINNTLHKRGATCPHCGAPAVTKICKYCEQPTGLEQDVAIASMEYPVVDFENVHYDTTVYRLFLMISVGMLIATAFIFMIMRGEEGKKMLPLLLLFGLAGVFLLFEPLKHTLVAYYVKSKGEKFTAIVLGTVDNKEDSLSNAQGEETVKLLFHTNKGYRIVLHKTGYDKTESYIKDRNAVTVLFKNNKYLIKGDK